MRARPVPQAYADTGALAVACPNCEAAVGAWCVKADGRVARTPCLDRIIAADLAPISDPTKAAMSDPTPLTVALTLDLGLPAEVDFSEPRHPRSIP